MHAARLYASAGQKKNLAPKVAPQILVVDECHHAASEGDLAGVELNRRTATQTYMAVKQLISGNFWPDSTPPQMVILMSATPFRSSPQFVNLLRLLTHGLEKDDKSVFDAFDARIQSIELRAVLQDAGSNASIVWRQQSDESVRSWSGGRIFPNLKVKRPHRLEPDDTTTPPLPAPSPQFLQLMAEIRETVVGIARRHGQPFAGFAVAQLEKKLTSSSMAGACWLFSWAVRHSHWETQDEFRKDKGEGTEGLRRLIRKISKRLATFNQQTAVEHATVSFPSESFEFTATSLSQAGAIADIQKYSKSIREDMSESSSWVADEAEVLRLVELAEKLLDLGMADGAEDAKLKWLNELLSRHPEDRILLFTESLQTCETLRMALGTRGRVLVGSMSKADRNQAVTDLSNPRMNARVLVATSAADEGFDIQVACKVVHWDISSSPATLMQRNGRVARLGQVRDVLAYYLILTGTHEERRDSALINRFAELGIEDESLRSRILGSLSEEEENRLEQAIDENEEGVVGHILSKATEDNKNMDKELAEIKTTLNWSQVLGRDDLAKRLQAWKLIGMSGTADREGIKLDFDTVQWDRPVFEEVARMERTDSNVARIRCKASEQNLVFDPEFLVFGPKNGGEKLELAGLPPWLNTTSRFGRHCIVPFDQKDHLGRLFQMVARLRKADFISISRNALAPAVPFNEDAKWLLFCTHPLREVENVPPPKLRPYLTYYLFNSIQVESIPQPVYAEGAEAEQVHKIISQLEKHAMEGLDGMCSGLSDLKMLESAKMAGTSLQKWLESVTQFGAASFLEQEKYFVPIPVALVMLLE